MNTKSKYSYRPLNAERREIRVLQIWPWTQSPNEQLFLSLKHTELDNAEPFDALSYTWGDPNPTFEVKLGGANFEVREGLHTALLNFRKRDESCFLWADAICINQDDTRERESQVSIMQYIFSTAQSVFAWLGESTEGDLRAFDFLHDLCSKFVLWLGVDDDDDDDDDDGDATATMATADNKDAIEWIRSVTPLGMVDSPWLDVISFLEKPLFHRIWVVQELVLGKVVEVFCGNKSMGFSYIHLAAKFIGLYGDTIFEFANNAALMRADTSGAYEFYNSFRPYSRLIATGHTIAMIGACKQRLRGRKELEETDGPTIMNQPENSDRNNDFPTQSSPQSITNREWTSNGGLYALFRRFRALGASDPRDKVYALLGIADAAEGIPILPAVHYDLDMFYIMRNLILAHIQNGGTLDFLSDGCGIEHPSGLASWMPLWYKPVDTMLSQPLKDSEIEHHIQYRAGRHKKAYARGNINAKSISLCGGRLAVIESTTDTYDMVRNGQDPPPKNISEILQDAADLMGVAHVIDASKSADPTSPEEQASQTQRYISTTTPEERRLLDSYHSIETMSVQPLTNEEFCQVLQDTTDFLAIKNTAETPMNDLDTALSMLTERLLKSWQGRRFFKSKDSEGKSWFGLCPADAQPGDEIACFIGADVLFVIRKQEDVGGEPVYGLVGEAYMQGMMSGEALEKMIIPGDPEKLNCETIQLI